MYYLTLGSRGGTGEEELVEFPAFGDESIQSCVRNVDGVEDDGFLVDISDVVSLCLL